MHKFSQPEAHPSNCPQQIKKPDIKRIYVELSSRASPTALDVRDAINAVEQVFAKSRLNSEVRRASANEMFNESRGGTECEELELYEVIELDRKQ